MLDTWWLLHILILLVDNRLLGTFIEKVWKSEIENCIVKGMKMSSLELSTEVQWLGPSSFLLERFRFEDENETSTRFNLKFLLVFPKKDIPESFILLIFAKKVSTVIYTEGG